MPIWKEIGFRPTGFWTTIIGDNYHALMYMLGWESLDERQAKWRVFTEDRRWIEAKKRTETDGPLVPRITNTILREALSAGS